MTKGWPWTKRVAIVAGALALGTGGCATTQSTENLLTQAGFRQVPADTPSKMAHLETLPDHRLVARVHGGQKYYVFADPSGCKCLYIGRSQQYQNYRQLVQEQHQAEATAVDEAREWEIENSGLQ
ncbi:MAG TPA: hypothetical protein VMS64_33210 [Candidatus Methylomirabilis sp.]|nr:hypothetical protein [Candidatus Methylomirabilis sp.]